MSARAGTSASRPLLASAVVLALLLTITGSAAAKARPSVRHATDVTAYNARGRVLPVQPSLRIGQHITIVVRGFASRAIVNVVDTNVRKRHDVRADGLGTAHVPYTVPRTRPAQRNRLVLFAGPIAPRPAHRASTARAVGVGDVQNITGSVPLLRRFPYRVPPIAGSGNGSGNGGSGGGSGTGGVHTGSGGSNGGHGLASTGTDVLGLVELGLLLLVVGAIVTRAGRGRRRRAISAPRQASDV